MNSFKKKLLQREKIYCGWITLNHPVIAEIMARAGFDAVVIDLEHSAITLAELEPLCQVVEGFGSVPIVRLSSNDPVLIKRVLDIGAKGIVVPWVNTKEEAQEAVRAAHYPPKGIRGTGLYRSQEFGSAFHEYRSNANSDISIIAQIEHKEGVENIDSILSVEGIDAVMIGPYDLSSSLGVPGELTHPLVLKAQEKVIAAAQKHKKVVGRHFVQPHPGDIKEYHDQFQLFFYTTDAIVLNEHFRVAVQQFRKL